MNEPDYDGLPLLHDLIDTVHYVHVGSGKDFDRPEGAETSGPFPWWDTPASRHDPDDDPGPDEPDEPDEPAKAKDDDAKAKDDATKAAAGGGHWVTLDDGQHVYIQDGQVHATRDTITAAAQRGKPPTATERASAPKELLSEHLEAAIRELAPNHEWGQTALVPEIRKRLPSLSKEDFDQALIQADRSGRLSLGSHNDPHTFESSESSRGGYALAEFTPNGRGSYYVSAGIRAK